MNDFQPGQTYKVKVSEITCSEHGDVPLKEAVDFEVVYKSNAEGNKNFLFSVGAGAEHEISLTTSSGETALISDLYGSETIEEAAIRIGKSIGRMYSILAESSLEEVTPNEEKIRSHLLTIERNRALTQEALEQKVADLMKSGNRRKIIYTWYAENCISFPKN